MRRAILILVVLLSLCPQAQAAGHEHPERWYQERWCADRGQMEVVLRDGSRCDCLTETHAVEFDFAHKWAESIGQSLNYAAQTGKRPGIVLILESPADDRHLKRIKAVERAFGLGLTVWTMDRNGHESPPLDSSALRVPESHILP